MSKKISEFMEHLEEELIEGIEDAKVNKKMADRIKTQALQGIRIAEENNAVEGTDIVGGNEEESVVSKTDSEAQQKYIERQTKVKPIRFMKNFKKALLIAAALCALIGGTVGAISVSETLQEFFSESLELVLPDTQEINQSMSQNGVTMTVKTAVADNTGGLVVIQLTKDDGSAFEPGSELKEFHIDVASGGSRGYWHEWELSEDNKVLTYIASLTTTQNIAGEGMCIKGTDVVIVTQVEEEVSIDLSTGYVQESKENKTQENIGGELFKEEESLGDRTMIGISLGHPYSDLMISKYGFVNGRFFIETKDTYREGSIWQMLRLVDTRTGKTVGSDGGQEQYTSDHPVRVGVDWYDEIKESDLPYIKPVIMYNTYESVVEGDWAVDFILKENKNVKTWRGKQKIELDGNVLELTNVELSLLGGKLDGIACFNEGSGGSGRFEPEIIVWMEDGSSLSMNQTHSSSGGEGEVYTMGVERGRSWNTYTEEEKAKLRAEAEENMYKRQAGITKLSAEKFIDVEQVVSIQIEDTVIPLK